MYSHAASHAASHHVFETTIATVKEYCIKNALCCCPIVTVEPEDEFDIEKGIIDPSQSRSEYVSLADDPIEAWFMTSATRRASIIANRPSGFILRLNQS